MPSSVSSTSVFASDFPEQDQSFFFPLHYLICHFSLAQLYFGYEVAWLFELFNKTLEILHVNNSGIK